MPDETKAVATIEGSEGEDLAAAAPKKGKTKLFIIIGGVIALLGVSAGVLFFTPFGKGLLGAKPPSAEEAAAAAELEKVKKNEELAFVDLPEILVNLRSQTGRGGFLKISMTMEIEDHKDEEKIKSLKPLIVDQFQIYLRELDVEDVKGSSGLQRIRQELHQRVNTLAKPIKIINILFKEFLVQ